MGVVPEAVSWEWLPRAPCCSICCREGRPACEFAGLHHPSDSVRSACDAVASGLPIEKKNAWVAPGLGIGRGPIGVEVLWKFETLILSLG